MALVKLRAFEIINPDFNKSSSDLEKKLRVKLQDSTAATERRMLLNADDPQQEEDLISDFTPSNQSCAPAVFCTMLRLAIGKNIQHVDNLLFSRPNFTISDLNSSEIEADAIYKNHYYFSVCGRFLVTTLPGNTTIVRLQTYLNWLLDDLYEINPLIDKANIATLAQVKNITVRDPATPQRSFFENNEKSSFNIVQKALECLREALTDTQSVSDHQLEQMISAKLVIEFKKPDKNDLGYVKRAFGALLKPISDLDNFEFHTRGNKKIIKGGSLYRTKEVNIETTESGMISEAQLAQEMSRFIKELGNEHQKAID